MTKTQKWLVVVFVLIMLDIVSLFYISGVEAAPSGTGITPYPTITARGETPFTTGTQTWGTQAPYRPVCTSNYVIPTSIFPTHLFSTVIWSNTETPIYTVTNTPTVTPSVTGTPSGLVRINFTVALRISDDRGYPAPSGSVVCQRDGGETILSGKGAINFISTFADCTGGFTISSTGGWYNTLWYMEVTAYRENSGASISYYYKDAWVSTGAGADYSFGNSVIEGYKDLPYTPSFMNVGGKSLNKNTGSYAINVNFCGDRNGGRCSESQSTATPTNTLTPTMLPATATAWSQTQTAVALGCDDWGGGGGAGEPIAWIAPPRLRLGECITILPGMYIDFSPVEVFGQTGLDLQPMGFCPTYVTLDASVLGFGAEWLLTAYLVIQSIFWIANEIRS